MSIRSLDSESDLPLTAQERLALQDYDAERDRGLVHFISWQQLMAKLRKLAEEEDCEDAKCPGRPWGKSPRDPSFNFDHDFDTLGECRQCGLRQEIE